MAAIKKASSNDRAWRNEFEQAFTEGHFKDAARVYDLSAGPSERIDVTIRGAQAHMHFDPPNGFESADIRLGGYRSVRRHLQAEDPATARRALELARKGQSHKARIYALHAEALILWYEEHVRDQADRLVELLRSIDPQKTEFVNIRAWGTHNLAILARELTFPTRFRRSNDSSAVFPGRPISLKTGFKR